MAPATKERLSTALSIAGAPDWMVKNADNGFYDDFESPLPTPCVQLVADLRSAGLHSLAEKAMDGEWDATKEESDAWYEREGKDLLNAIIQP